MALDIAITRLRDVLSEADYEAKTAKTERMRAPWKQIADSYREALAILTAAQKGESK